LNLRLRNDDGVLKEDGTASPTGFIPAGSYKLTCRNIKVALTCDAKTEAGNWISAGFNLTNVAEADLCNDNGILKNAYRTVSLYVPGAFYSGEDADATIEKLRNSGFNTIVAWAFYVSERGDITNQGTVVQNGKYVGRAEWGERLEKLKQTPSSVNRLLFSIWGDNDFDNIRNLIFPS
jgi:hypothetical protein